MKLSGWLQRLTPFDRKLAMVLSLLVLLSFLLPLRQGAGTQLVVSSGDEILFVAPLDQDQLVDLHGPLGTTQLQIRAGSAKIISSPCRQKICIGMGEVQHSGQLLACVPNRLVFHIEGDRAAKEAAYDLLSR